MHPRGRLLARDIERKEYEAEQCERLVVNVVLSWERVAPMSAAAVAE